MELKYESLKLENQHNLKIMKEDYENKIKKIKEENMNNIKKFQDYLKILKNRIVYKKNEISIIYKINKNENKLRIFDSDFVKAKKEFCKILIDGQEYELQENLDISNINKNLETLEIKLKVNGKITSFYSMFYKCTSLLYLPVISKFNTSNFISMCDMFCDCSSLSFLPDISKWNTSEVTTMAEMFSGCTSLLFLLDISNWDICNVTDLLLFIIIFDLNHLILNILINIKKIFLLLKVLFIS